MYGLLQGCTEIPPLDPKAAAASVGLCVFAVAEDSAEEMFLPVDWAQGLVWALGVLHLPTLAEMQVDAGPNTSNEVRKMLHFVAFL
eukprot:scaffold339708_cov34-Prasinocladus_malaysianus.AAC.1